MRPQHVAQGACIAQWCHCREKPWFDQATARKPWSACSCTLRSCEWSVCHQSMTLLQDMVRQSSSAAQRQAMCNQHQLQRCPLLYARKLNKSLVWQLYILVRHAQGSILQHRQLGVVHEARSFALVRLVDHCCTGLLWELPMGTFLGVHLHPWSPIWEGCAESSGPTGALDDAPCWRRQTPYLPSGMAGSCPPVFITTELRLHM